MPGGDGLRRVPTALAPGLNRSARIDAYVAAVASALAGVSEESHRAFVDGILKSDQIVVAGRGRSGMIASAFARRLGQMGLRAWGLDDTTVPRLDAGDTLVACTGSGTTPTVLSLMDTARSGGARVLAVTKRPTPEGISADVIVSLDVPKGVTEFPLGTLFEASLFGYLDQVVVDLIAALGATESELGARHTNLE